jgi:hypothetical protein
VIRNLNSRDYPHLQWSQLSTGEIAPFQMTSALTKYPALRVVRASPTGQLAPFRLRMNFSKFPPQEVVAFIIRNLNSRDCLLDSSLLFG